MKKVLLTGATGLIGKYALQFLLDEGFEVFAVSSKEGNGEGERGNKINWVKADLLNINDIKQIFEKVKPEYFLHFAWDTTPGTYLESNINFDWLKSSLEMLKQFKLNGGKRAVFAGTCFEYEFKEEPLKEDGKLNPQTVYAKCKCHLNELAALYSQKNDISFGWGRIFYVFGAQEQEKRLTPHVINSLRQNKEVIITSGKLIKDYIYAKDIAGAFVKFLASDVLGNVNICTSKPVSIENYVKIIAEKLNKTQFIVIKDEDMGEPPIIAGDNTRLVNEVGYKNFYSPDKALDEILMYE
jgi:GDP-6-deoxy-D-talose 4-dehydrogenase